MRFIVTKQPPILDSKEVVQEIEADSVSLDSTWAIFYRLEQIEGREIPVLHVAIPSVEIISIRREQNA